jgi:hypothetical protein
MPASPMPADQFWKIIERAGRSDHDPDAHMQALRAELCQLTLDEVISFHAAFRRYLNQTYTWELWGAAYVIYGGCSYDLFEYFRRWLVSKGRAVYEAAVADPDSLAQRDVQPGPEGGWDFEEIYNLAADVFEAKGGEGHVGDYVEREPVLENPPGEPFAENEEHLARRYPKLWQRFGAHPLD